MENWYRKFQAIVLNEDFVPSWAKGESYGPLRHAFRSGLRQVGGVFAVQVNMSDDETPTDSRVGYGKSYVLEVDLSKLFGSETGLAYEHQPSKVDINLNFVETLGGWQAVSNWIHDQVHEQNSNFEHTSVEYFYSLVIHKIRETYPQIT